MAVLSICLADTADLGEHHQIHQNSGGGGARMRVPILSAQHESVLRQTELAAFSDRSAPASVRDVPFTETKLPEGDAQLCFLSHELSAQTERPHNTFPPLHC